MLMPRCRRPTIGATADQSGAVRQAVSAGLQFLAEAAGTWPPRAGIGGPVNVSRNRRGPMMSNEATVANQKKILANQRRILGNQRRIEANQAKLDEVLVNQKKLDRILANQKTILSKLR
jgi:hypothetical protein